MESDSGAPKELPSGWKQLTVSCYIYLFFTSMCYYSGIWELQVVDGHLMRDGLDEFILYSAPAVGLMGLFALLGSWKYLEK
jgi:hypothetical protein